MWGELGWVENSSGVVLGYLNVGKKAGGVFFTSFFFFRISMGKKLVLTNFKLRLFL